MQDPINKHWLVLTSDGWRAFEHEQQATSVHCANIERQETSYLVQGQTLDANGGELEFALIQEKQS